MIDPRDPTISYAAAEGYEYWGDYPGSLGKTTNSGVSWQKTSPEPFESVLAVAVDPVAISTVYIATGEYMAGWGGWGAGSGTAPEVLRSDDGGATWTSANMGLPSDGVRSLAVDPHVSGTLYAGTETGVYRSRDSGRSWTPFSQVWRGSRSSRWRSPTRGVVCTWGHRTAFTTWKSPAGPWTWPRDQPAKAACSCGTRIISPSARSTERDTGRARLRAASLRPGRPSRSQPTGAG